MNARQIAATLSHEPKRMPVTVNGWPVTAVQVADGRITRDMMSTTFREMPEKPRDQALVMRFGEGVAMTVDDVRKVLATYGDLELFVWGTQVSAIRGVEASYDRDKKRYIHSPGSAQMVATPLHWTELSDGTQAETYVWTRPLPTRSHHEETTHV